MRLLLPVLLVVAILHAPAGIAQDPEPPYHVKPEVGAFEAPADRGDAYDCAGGGPYGVLDTVFYDVDETIEWGGRKPSWMGIPYVGPECLAVDVRTEDPSTPSSMPASRGIPDCRDKPVDELRGVIKFDRLPEIPGPPPVPVLEATLRATYNVSSGQYYLLVDVPGNVPLRHGTQDGHEVELSGSTGVSVKFDCRECEPPW